MKAHHLCDIFSFLLYGLVFAISLSFIPDGSDTLVVEADGIEYAYSLQEDGIYSFTGALGTTEIEINGGRARIISSPCPNGTCIRQSWSKTLCCLPNRVIATVGGESDVDAISG